MRVLQHGKVVAEIPNQALTDDAPVYKRPLERWEPPVPREMPEHIKLAESSDFTANLKRLLASPNICGKRWVWQQYDHMVQTNTVEGPGAGDAGVIRIKGSQRGLAMALDGNGRWCYLDPRLGAMHAVAEAARNVACSGATPVGATNCLNFGNPEKPHIMWQFSQVIDGITKACEELEIPITGGNVSFYNETLGEGIYPTPVLGVVGIIEDVHKAAKSDFREPGRAIVLCAAASRAMSPMPRSEFGSSEYAKEILGALWGYPPELELGKRSCAAESVGRDSSDRNCGFGARLFGWRHGCSLAESDFREGHWNARRIWLRMDLPAEFVLFGEDASRIVISCDPEKVARIKQIAVKYGIAADMIGETIPERMEIKVDGKVVVSAGVSELRDAYEGALERALRTDPSLAAVGPAELARLSG